MHRHRRPFFAAHLAAAILCAIASTAAPAAGTLEKIAAKGAIVLGYRESSLPFSYLDENHKPVGYSMDICDKVVEAVRRELKRSDIAVKHVAVTTSTRISALVAGDIDLECGSTTSTTERRKQVDFTIPTFVAATRLLSRSDAKIASIYDLAGKTVVTTQGASSEQLFKEHNESRALRAKLILAKDHAESFGLVEAGKADAFIMDDVLLSSLRAASKNPENYVITRDPLTIEPLAIMLRKDDPSFKKLVDTEVARLITRGEVNALYRKWFESPIPPNGINLKLPMSYMLRDSFKVPSDWVPK